MPLPLPDVTATPKDLIYPVPFFEAGGTSNWSTDQTTIPYHECGLAITYEWNQGTLQLPVAASFGPSSLPASELIQLHAPSMKVMVEWEASRVGAPPIAPDPRPPSGSNYTLKSFRFGGKAPELAGDGKGYLYRIAGVYHYLLAVPNSPDFGYQLGALPTQTGPLYVYSASEFRSTIFQLA